MKYYITFVITPRPKDGTHSEECARLTRKESWASGFDPRLGG